MTGTSHDVDLFLTNLWFSPSPLFIPNFHKKVKSLQEHAMTTNLQRSDLFHQCYFVDQLLLHL